MEGSLMEVMKGKGLSNVAMRNRISAIYLSLVHNAHFKIRYKVAVPFLLRLLATLCDNKISLASVIQIGLFLP